MGQPTKDGLANFMEGLKSGEADQVSSSTQNAGYIDMELWWEKLWVTKGLHGKLK